MEQEKSLWQYFVDTIKVNYFNFKGRARRREFFGFKLFYWTIWIILTQSLVRIHPNFHLTSIGSVLAVLFKVFSIATFIPNFAISVRRLHDCGNSWWWYPLIVYVCPFILGYVVKFTLTPILPHYIPVPVIRHNLYALFYIIMIIWLLRDGQPFTNKWGPDPKHREQERPL